MDPQENRHQQQDVGRGCRAVQHLLAAPCTSEPLLGTCTKDTSDFQQRPRRDLNCKSGIYSVYRCLSCLVEHQVHQVMLDSGLTSKTTQGIEKEVHLKQNTGAHCRAVRPSPPLSPHQMKALPATNGIHLRIFKNTLRQSSPVWCMERSEWCMYVSARGPRNRPAPNMIRSVVSKCRHFAQRPLAVARWRLLTQWYVLNAHAGRSQGVPHVRARMVCMGRRLGTCQPPSTCGGGWGGGRQHESKPRWVGGGLLRLEGAAGPDWRT